MTFPLDDISDPIIVNNMGLFDLFDLNTKLGKKNNHKQNFRSSRQKTPTENQHYSPVRQSWYKITSTNTWM
jgi:hypothetical protein